MFIAKDKNIIVAIGDTKEELMEDLKLKNYDIIQETDVVYKMYKGSYLTEKEIAKKEKERISHLKCTKRVLVLLLQEYGKDYYNDILPLIEANKQAKLEWDLCVELERSNPLLDSIGQQLGITPEEIDNLFKYANGEIGSLGGDTDGE